jgi:hypothetical protein
MSNLTRSVMTDPIGDDPDPIGDDQPDPIGDDPIGEELD